MVDRLDKYHIDLLYKKDKQIELLEQRIVNLTESHTKWEYTLMSMYTELEVIQHLGKEGWELCGISPNYIYHFKRPIL